MTHNRAIFTCIFLWLFCAAAQADMLYSPPDMMYDPRIYMIDHPDAKLGNHGLPPGTGSLIQTFAQLLGLIAVWKSLNLAHEVTNTGGRGGDSSWGSVIGFFIAGICVFHLQRTMGTLAATLPGFPDLTPILQY